MGDTKRILIADDHSIFRAGLKRLLEAADGLNVVAEASTGEEAIKRAGESSPDVVVLDVSMPGRGGIETLQELKRREPKVRILVLTMHSEDRFGVRCLREGADGYLTKDAGLEQLLTAVRKVSAGGKYVSPNLAERLALNLEGGFDQPAHEKLSNREFQVMRLIGAGSTASEIAAKLHLSVKTVSTYRSRILGKMKMRGNAEIMRYVIELHLGG
jgi:two-component system invasion response regulator UvrY